MKTSKQKSDHYLILGDQEKIPYKEVFREGDTVHRKTGTWASTVHSLLHRLESIGFAGSPRVVGSGFDSHGLETVTHLDGEFMHPGPWTLEGVTAVGRLLRTLHDTTVSFCPPI